MLNVNPESRDAAKPTAITHPANQKPSSATRTRSTATRTSAASNAVPKIKYAHNNVKSRLFNPLTTQINEAGRQLVA